MFHVWYELSQVFVFPQFGVLTSILLGDALPPLSKRVYLPITHPQVQQKIKEIDHECLGINPQRWMVCTHVLGTDNRVEHHRFLDHISINTHEEICHHLWNDTIRYAFQTRTWEELGFNDPSQTFFLKTVHRQTNQAWIAILKKLKLGVMDNETMDYLESLKRPLDCEQAGVQPTKIFALRKDADAVNKMEFNKLKGPVYTYEAVDQGIRHVMMDGEFKHIALSSGALEAESNCPIL